MPGPTDDQLLRMLQQVEAREQALDDLDLDAPNAEPKADPCLWCGEPAEHRGECHVCGEEGCLPGDLWTPGDADPCLTLCVRCARTIHLGCRAEDEAGNPRCPSCRY